jgi:hypothetical protein
LAVEGGTGEINGRAQFSHGEVRVVGQKLLGRIEDLVGRMFLR